MLLSKKLKKDRIKKLLKYTVPFIALALIFALACGGSGSSIKEVSKVEEKTEAVEEAEVGSKDNPYSINESITINNEVKK